jgi:hypothetical protein
MHFMNKYYGDQPKKANGEFRCQQYVLSKNFFTSLLYITS